MSAHLLSRQKLSFAFSALLSIVVLCGYTILKGTAVIPAATPFPDGAPTQSADGAQCDAAWQERARGHLRSVEMTHGPESAAAAAAIDTVLECVLPAAETATAVDVEIAERSLRINEKLHGPASEQAAAGHLSLAAIHWRHAKYAEAFPHVRSVLEIRSRLYGAESLPAAAAIYEFAEAHRMVGNFAEAIRLHAKGLVIREKLGETESAAVAGALHYLGVLWWSLGDYAKARPLIERSLAMREKFLGPDDALVAVSLNTLANLVSHTGDRETARKHYIRAQAIWEKAKGPDHPDVARSLSNQGILLAETGRLEEAGPLLERALEIRVRALGADSFLVARSLVNLADVRAGQGDLAGAEALLDRAVAIERKLNSEFHRESPSTFAGRASLNWAMGKLDAAMADSLEAEAVARDIFLHSSPGLTERETLKYEAGRTSGLGVALTVAALRAEAGGPEAVAGLPRIWNEVILSQALVLDLLAGDARPNVDPVSDAARVAEALPEHSALVVYVRYDRHLESKRTDTTPSYIAMVLKPRSAGEAALAPHVVSLGPAETIERLIQEWRREASHDPRIKTAGKEVRAYRLAGGRLREAIWDPISPAVAGAETVFVVPDGAINLVSLATLPTSNGRYMIETEPMIHYLSAARDLATMGPRTPAGAGVLVMGGADYDRAEVKVPMDHDTGDVSEAWLCHPEAAAMKFAPLPESLIEAQEVASRLRTREEVLMLTGAEAGEYSFKRLAPGRRILHLATHGFFFSGGCMSSPRPPDEGSLALSGLALAGANRRPADGSGQDADEGILMADEIASLDLSSVEWVVLSGCQTGVGEILDGEGVLGLRRAFQIAGARTLIMSLWPVEDSAARLWMRRLYDNRLAGRGTTVSVSNASLDLLAEQRAAGRTTHPYFWGAFVSVGDWK